MKTITWQDLTRRLAQHINQLHQTARQTRASRTEIARWREQLDTPAVAAANRRGQKRGGLR